MERLTECHGGKAVIKDKNLLPQAMERLAEYEKLEEKGCVIRWHPADEPPKNDRYILLSHENFPMINIGRYEGDDEYEYGGEYFSADGEIPLTEFGIFVNAWAELPERME